MIPSIDVPAASIVISETHSHNIKEEEFGCSDNDDVDDDCLEDNTTELMENLLPNLIEKSVIIHKDENGFGLRLKGQAPVFVEHVHENGAAWRAGVRRLDTISKVNGISVAQMDHKNVILMFKSCTRFIGLTLLSPSLEFDFDPNQLSDHLSMNYQSSLHESNLLMANNPLVDTSKSASCTSSIRSKNLRLNRLYAQLDEPINSQSCGTLTANGSLTGSGSVTSFDRASLSAYQSSYLSTLHQVSSLYKQQQHLLSRRSSIEGDDSNEPQVELSKCRAVCISCRTVIYKTGQLNVETCSKCQLKFGSNFKNKSHADRHRLYGSLRASSRNQTVSQPNRKVIHSSNANQATNETEKEQYSCKLTQSASISNVSSKATKPDNKNASSLDVPTKVGLSRQPTTNKRMEIIRELIDTEKTHTERLKCLDELFYRPLKGGNLMTAEQLRQVFSCHRTLYKIHRQIYRILLSANFNLYTEPMIGSALLEIFEGDLRKKLERASCSYCAAQSSNVDLLNKLTRRDTKSGEFIAQVTSQQMVGRLGIKDLLASCFQRLTKYPLLLENLLKATPSDVDDSIKIDQQNIIVDSIENDSNDAQDKEERNTRRMLAIGLAEEREFIERALHQSRQILVKVNETIKVAMSRNKLKEIWKRTDKYPGVPLIDITKQQVVHEGLLTLRLARRSFDVYVLLLNDYLIILTREGQDKYRLKFFTPDGKSSSSSSSNSQSVYSPVFVIDEHLTTRDAATDENGFYLLCKRKDDSRIYEFASRSPDERMKWRERIQWTVERQMSKGDRRSSYESAITKSSSDLSANKRNLDDSTTTTTTTNDGNRSMQSDIPENKSASQLESPKIKQDANSKADDGEPIKIAGTISYVEDDGIVLPSKMESTKALVERAIQVNIFDTTTGTTVSSSS